MKVKKILLICLMAIMLILCGRNFVYADSLTVNAVSDRKNYAPGQTVIITVSLTNIDSSLGIYGLSGVLDYDETVFEEIVSDEYGVSENVTSLISGGTILYNPKYIEDESDPNCKPVKFFSIDYMNPAKTDTKIFQIALKVKETAKLGNTEILLNKLSAGNGGDEGDITTSAALARINITTSGSSGEIPIATPTPDAATPTPSPATKVPTKTPTKMPTKTPTPSSNLPQTGLNEYIVPALFVVLIVSIVSYIAYKKYKGI